MHTNPKRIITDAKKQLLELLSPGSSPETSSAANPPGYSAAAPPTRESGPAFGTGHSMSPHWERFKLPDGCDEGPLFDPDLQPLAHAPEKWKYQVDQCLILQEPAKVRDAPLPWIWPGRIPFHALTLLAGDPGVGKSLLTIDMAARASRGDFWPDDPQTPYHPKEVFLISGEDSFRRTIRPRLVKAGADLKHVHFVAGVSSHCAVGQKRWNRGFVIPDDVPGLVKLLEDYSGYSLVIIDPISALARNGGVSDMFSVRQMLRPLEECADRTAAAIVCVTHLNKTTRGSGIYRVMGSLGFTAASRAVWGVTRDKNDPQRRLFLPVKLNLAETRSGLAFRITEGGIVWEPEPVPLLWDEALTSRQVDSRNPRAQRDAAVIWLQELLAEGPQSIEAVRREAAAADISAKMLRKAKDELQLQPFRERFDSPWQWKLGPAKQTPEPPSAT